MKQLEGKVAIVTGSTSGIGAATAKTFAINGAFVVLTGRNIEKGMTVEKEIINAGGNAKFFQCDVSNKEEAQVFIEKVIKKFKKIDILFNNAGVMLPSMEIERMSIENWKKTFAVNIDGMFYITRMAKPYLLKSKGTIINNGSIAGLQSYTVGRSYAYSASKAAVIQFSRQMAKNYGEEGIRVNCICPGIIDTPILGDRDRKVYAERIPLGYVAQPSEVAKVVLFLASDQAAYLTGVVLPIDGGASL